MQTIKVEYNGKVYDGTLVSYNADSDTYFVDVSVDGKWSTERAFPGENVRNLNPALKTGGKPLQKWRR